MHTLYLYTSLTSGQFLNKLSSKLATKLALSPIFIFSLLLCNLAHAESNVAGEEITIFSDDTFKPMPRGVMTKELSDDSINTQNSAGDTLRDALDTRLHDDTGEYTADDQSDIINIGSADLWQRIKDGYGIPNSKSSLVAKHEDYYSSRPDYVKRIVERSQKYLFHIVEEVEKRNMPTEIALLPMIESAYNPNAYSTSRASGIWQFVPATGKHFGLKQNWWTDNRRNVTLATDAALDYLQKLHGMFGSWDLALAAYNAGEGTVGRAIERNRKLGLGTDYESITLPVETRNYFPKLQAIKNLMTNPGKYGLKIQTIANTPYFARVSAPAQIDAHLAAKLAEISDEEFLALNPSNNRPVITSNSEKHELLLPIASAQTFRTNLAAYNNPLVSWRTYFAKRGERMENIAARFGIPVDQLRNANNLPAHEKINKSSTILVPNGSRADFVATKSANIDSADATLIDETAIADNDVSTKQNSANIDIASAEKLAVIATAEEDAESKAEPEPIKQSSVTHKVKKGETLQSIAKRYGVNVKQIMKLSALKNKRVNAGQTLTIKPESIVSAPTNRQAKSRASSKSGKVKQNGRGQTKQKANSRKSKASSKAKMATKKAANKRKPR
ncbi:MAG: transglycosylase SLT domain-containing protein [Methylotenera sp.]|nr:transglycosylase SLT domain-containing protein [Methylotenera sp.]